MTYNSLIALFLAWFIGILVGPQIVFYTPEAPSLFAVWGMILLAAALGMFFFGTLAWLFLFFLGVLASPLVFMFPISGSLLGICLVSATLFGKTLGEFGLEDVYVNGEIRLQNYAIAALYDVLFVLAFGFVVWAMWSVFPDLRTLFQILPLAGWGV